MKLKTSFFNAAVLKKDITRFSPLWGLYTVFILLSLAALNRSHAYQADQFALSIRHNLSTQTAIYAGLCALCLFGDLFVPRLSGALHAMPLKRDGWFLTHSFAAFLFFLVPNLVYVGFAAISLGSFSYLVGIYLAVATLQFLCFFGIATFCIQCTGNRLGAVAIYLLMNNLALLIFWLFQTFYESLLFGVIINETILYPICPALQFAQLDYIQWNYNYATDTTTFLGLVGSDWLYLGLSALAGVGLMVAALAMYRRRKLESAGNFIAFRPAAPVFLVLYTFFAGTVLLGMGAGFGDIGFLLLGLAIGWFTGHMLLEKQLKVFRKKVVAGFGIFLGVFILTLLITLADPLGITRYVPEANQVSCITLSPNAYYLSASTAAVTDPTQIQYLTQMHRQLSIDRQEPEEGVNLYLQYSLKNGKTVKRCYVLDTESGYGRYLQALYSAPETVLGNGDEDTLKQEIHRADIYSYSPDEEKPADSLSWNVDAAHWDALLDAVIADCQAGNMAQIWEYHEDDPEIAILELQIGNDYRGIHIYKSCENTLAFLQLHAQDPQTDSQ